MTEQTLRDRIASLESKKEKAENTALKYYKKMRDWQKDEIDSLPINATIEEQREVKGIILRRIEQDYHAGKYSDVWDSYDEERRVEGYFNKQKELLEIKDSLKKLNAELDAMMQKNSKPKVEVLWNFLLKWKDETFEGVKKNAEKFYALKNDAEEAWNEYCERNGIEPELSWGASDSEKTNWYSKKKWWKEAYYSDIWPLTYHVYWGRGLVDEKKLENVLTEDIQKKYDTTMAKVQDICGEVVDASDLHIGIDGWTLDGYIKGTEGTAHIHTIGAGGWNIQRFHFRVLVHPVKD